MCVTYMDWATTALSPHPEVCQKISDYLFNLSKENSAVHNMEIAFQTRQAVTHYFNADSPMQVVLTPNVTQSLNMVLNGLIKTGDHVITTNLEHNAVARPLSLLEKKLGIDVTYLPCGIDGEFDPQLVEEAIRPATRLVVMTHASNVLGTVLPVKTVFQIAKKNGILTILDTAQTAGFLPINCKDMEIDVLCFTGHKSIAALQGSGGFVVRNGVEEQILPWLVGGTGSLSESLIQPEFMPDKFESGTKNYPAIFSLGQAIQLLEKEQVSYRKHEEMITSSFLEAVRVLPARILGPSIDKERVPLVSIVPEDMASSELHSRLQDEYSILTRYGLHCSPFAHQTAGSFETGAVRFSFGYSTTQSEVQYAIDSLTKILGKRTIS